MNYRTFVIQKQSSKAIIIVIACLVAYISYAQEATLYIDPYPDGIKNSSLALSIEQGFHRSTLLGEMELETDSLPRAIKVKLDMPAVLYLDNYMFAIGDGDSVHFSFDTTENKYFIKGGKYPGNYYVFTKLMNIKEIAVFDTVARNITDYTEQLEDVYAHRIRLLDSLNNTGQLSADVNQLVRSFALYLRVVRLLQPFSGTEIRGKWQSLFDGVQEDKLLNALYTEPQPDLTMYQLAVLSYFTAKAYSIGKDSEINRSLFREIREGKFSDRNKERLLYSLIVNSSMVNDVDKSLLSSVYNQLMSGRLSVEERGRLSKAYKKLVVEGNQIPDSVLAETFVISTDGRTFSLKTILEGIYAERILIDFWASWCKPCISAMPRIRQWNGENPETIVLYFSLDKKHEYWEKSYQKLGLSYHQYRVVNSFDSPLAKYIALTEIPRYIFFDNKRRMYNKGESLLETPK